MKFQIFLCLSLIMCICTAASQVDAKLDDALPKVEIIHSRPTTWKFSMPFFRKPMANMGHPYENQVKTNMHMGSGLFHFPGNGGLGIACY